MTALSALPAVAQNGEPVVVDDTYNVEAGQTLSVDAPGLLGNDYDPNGDALSVTGFGSLTNGQALVNANGEFSYTPDAGFTGTDSFVYTIEDGGGATGQGTVTIKVQPDPNRAPIAADDTYAAYAGQTLTIESPGVISNDYDPDGDALSARSYSPPSNGDVSLISSGEFTYTPDAGFTGTDSFSYTMADDGNESASATVTIEVLSGTQTTPFAQNDAYTTTIGTPLIIEAPGVLANDRSPTAESIIASSYGSPSNGTSSGFIDGRLEYTPDASFTGTETFSYTLRDGNGSTTTGTIDIVVRNPNRAPVALPDVYVAVSGQSFTEEAPGLLGNDTDPDGDAISARSSSSTSNGDLTLTTSGEFTYTPDAGFTGTDSFSYTMADGNGRSDNATVTLDVQVHPNRAPVALVDRYSMFQDRTITIDAPGVLENDYDPDGDALSARSYSSASNGDLTLTTSGELTYTPDAGFTGTDSFSYTMADSNGESASTTVEIAVASDAVLPVELAGLEAAAAGERVTVTWKTLSETNNTGFEVQRRIDEGDPYEVVGTVAGAGTTTETQQYRFDDVLPFTAEGATYRLKQTDADGTTAFSPTVNVRRGPGTEVRLAAPFPNPTRQRATVRYVVPEGESRPVRLDVYNLLGQRVATLVNETQNPGREEIRLDASRWASGSYVLRMQVGETMRTERLTVVR